MPLQRRAKAALLAAAVALAAWWGFRGAEPRSADAATGEAAPTDPRIAGAPREPGSPELDPPPGPDSLPASTRAEAAEFDDPMNPAGGCADAGFDDCPFLDPAPETLAEMARCGIVRYELPEFFSVAGQPRLDEAWVESTELTLTERAAVLDAAATHDQRHHSELVALAVEAGIDRRWAESSSSFLVWGMLEQELDPDAARTAGHRIAEERSDRRPPPLGPRPASLAERTLRLVSGAGDRLQREVANRLGPARARELRTHGDGWPGRRRNTASSCRVEDARASAAEPFVPSTPAEAQRCLADYQGEGCSFLQPDRLTAAAMAECGVVRFELPVFVMTTTAEPTFDRAWIEAAGVTEAEQAALAEVGEAARTTLYDELVEQAVARGKTETWARQTPLLGLVRMFGDGDTTRAASRAFTAQLARERAGLTDVRPVVGTDPGFERFNRSLMDFGSTYERALAKRLGATRARELRAYDDGWPGNKVQTPSQCDDRASTRER